ncbi:ABC transporter substrate-binding protein [Nitratireductor soli]|uniref:ABC transporter substrate-binding protein n=1 Tax=Nitratireductor soli TaxID=1670619 RepID=UPI00065E3855|nr:ABC transporter substrate-binding protein [Nitratireductor soli]
MKIAYLRRLCAAAILAAGTAGAAHANETEAVFGFSGWSVGYLPTAIALDRLADMGYDIKAVELGGNSNQLQAAATGAIDISAIAQILDAMDQGLDSKFFLAGNSNEFLLVSKTGLNTCASLDGKSLGIHSVGSFVGQLALQYLAANCPDTKANVTVIEGSENRLAALIAGQLDSSVIDLQDWTLLNAKMPGKFEITSDFTSTMPIMRAAFAARPDFIATHQNLVMDWVKVHLDVYREIYENPQLLTDKGLELLGEIDPEVLPKLVAAFVEAKIWPADGGLSESSVQETIDFFNNDGEPFQKITAADVVDRTILDKALADR